MCIRDSIMVAIEQQIVPNTGPKSSPARTAKVTPGSVSATHPTTVITVYRKIAFTKFSSAICLRRFILPVPLNMADQPNMWLQTNTAIDVYKRQL